MFRMHYATLPQIAGAQPMIAISLLLSLSTSLDSYSLTMQLEGEWKLLHIEMRSIDMTSTGIAQAICPNALTVKSGKILLKQFGTDNFLLLRAHRSRSQYSVDICVNSVDSTMKGIYTIAGKTIVLCMETNPKEPRPTKLTPTSKDESRVLFVFSRSN